MIILGIDPGLQRTGYAIVKITKRKKLQCLDYGVIETNPIFSREKRLLEINKKINFFLKKYKPNLLVSEKIYFFKNLKTAIPVAEAGGVILLTAAKRKIPVFELTPLQIKFSLTGNGRAPKQEVFEKIKRYLKLKKEIKIDDAIDALACALTFVFKTT